MRNHAQRNPPCANVKEAGAAPWINELAEGLAVKDVQTVQRVIVVLRDKLEWNPSKRSYALKRRSILLRSSTDVKWPAKARKNQDHAKVI